MRLMDQNNQSALKTILPSTMSCAWGLVLTLFLRVSVGTGWPQGKYALLKPATGCPEGWKDQGWLFQATDNSNPKNDRSENLHIDGNVHPSYVLRSFCVKTVSDGENDWPDGRYCIYRKRERTDQASLVDGMEPGRIRLDDNKRSGSYKTTTTYISYLEWIDFTLNTRYKHLTLYFFCKTNGNTKVPISLPITKPFYLLPYGSHDCQQVEWMVATTEWITYDLTNPSVISTSGNKPFFSIITHSSNNKEITMYYCYYRSCNYTLNDTSGVFQSPGFPGKYPDGQLCSWTIVVPHNHTLHVHFTNFSLDEDDNLHYSEMINDNFQLNHTLHGHHNLPFTIIATDDVLFEFLTNEQEHSTGFRAEYTVFKTPEVTSSPPSITRTNTENLHTTTLTPETKNKTNNNTAETFKKSRVGECDEENTAILVVIPLICLIVFIAVAIILLYRWRSRKAIAKCEKCASARYSKQDAMNPTYDDAGRIPIQQRTSTATINTTMGTDDNDGQMYQALSHDQQPEYEAPDYSKQNGIHDPSTESELPEYHELEPMDNNVPDVVYDVLEGPDSDDGPSGDQMYQALDKETTQNPLYQSTSPATMVTRNPMYVDSAA